MLTRRGTLLGALALGACTQTGSPLNTTGNDARLAAVEQRVGGRVGVAVFNTANGAWLTHRAHERFAMASTFKLLLAAQMLHLDMLRPGFRDQQVLFNERDLVAYSPATQARLLDGPLGRMGEMSIEQLCEAAVVVSDNTAANLLLAGANGPVGLTGFLRANGDSVTRLDRVEPELNENAPGDERDTTSPDAMVRTMQRILLNDAVLNSPSRERLIGWMIACQTGRQRLRAGFPHDWRAGDKTGTGANGAVNDVAIAWPPGRAPVLVACYLSGSSAETSTLNAAHAEVGRIVAETWG